MRLLQMHSKIVKINKKGKYRDKTDKEQMQSNEIQKKRMAHMPDQSTP